MKKISIIMIFIITSILFSCEDNIKYDIPVDDVEEVTFSDVQSIFNSNCTACHNASGKDFYGGLDLSGNSFDKIVGVSSTQRSNELLVKKGSADESYLFRKVTGENIDGGIMPNPFNKLNNVQIQKIRTWIKEGALNN